MGICIHYSGRIADKTKLPQLIEEVKEIALAHGWKFQVYERAFTDLEDADTRADAPEKAHDGKLYGIDFTPPGSEPLPVCFLSNGRMSCLTQLDEWGVYRAGKFIETMNVTVDAAGKMSVVKEKRDLTRADFDQYLYQCSSKTHNAGPKIHKMIIGLFRYLDKTYLSDFSLEDETRFWETGDEELLEKEFEVSTVLIDGLVAVMQENERLPDEDDLTYIRRIVQIYQGRR